MILNTRDLIANVVGANVRSSRYCDIASDVIALRDALITTSTLPVSDPRVTKARELFGVKHLGLSNDEQAHPIWEIDG